jgi:hypothetical protein
MQRRAPWRNRLSLSLTLEGSLHRSQGGRCSPGLGGVDGGQFGSNHTYFGFKSGNFFLETVLILPLFLSERGNPSLQGSYIARPRKGAEADIVVIELLIDIEILDTPPARLLVQF